MAQETLAHQSSQVVLITGMSGSGKSVALHALEDAGYFCVDNLPPELLLSLVELDKTRPNSPLAIAMDARSAASLPLLTQHLASLRERGVAVQTLFLDASTETLVRRYSRPGASTPCRRG